MMTLKQAVELLEKFDFRENEGVHVSFPMSEAYANRNGAKFIAELKEQGYAAYIRTTEFGPDIVVTGEISDGDAGPPRS